MRNWAKKLDKIMKSSKSDVLGLEAVHSHYFTNFQSYTKQDFGFSSKGELIKEYNTYDLTQKMSITWLLFSPAKSPTHILSQKTSGIYRLFSII